MADYNTNVIEEFRANKGQVGGMFSGMDLLLLNTIGAKSGKRATIPVAYTKDSDNFVVVASKGGAPQNPSWYHNLVAHPDITIEVGDQTFPVQARLTSEPERERLFSQHASAYPSFNDYKAKTSRIIPVFVLEKVN